MELNKEKKMKSEQAVLPNPCLEEEECRRVLEKPHVKSIVTVLVISSQSGSSMEILCET
jgi:hypothetical protein